MALTPSQQLVDLIRRSRLILITFKRDWSGDSLASALVIATLIRKLDKQAEIVCDHFTSAGTLSFLKPNIKSSLNQLEQFVITVDTSRAPIGEFSYDTNSGDKLHIYLTPTDGQLTNEQISFATGSYRYDLIITLNTPDPESLGTVYTEHTDFWHATPKINIDHQASNEQYGTINLVDVTASSTAEVVYDLITAIDDNLIDETVATALLTGIISATKNFKIPHLTPKTLHSASLLLARGAGREQIVRELYQQRFLSTLKLWGRVLARLESDLDGRLVWTRIGQADFLTTGASADDLTDVIDELIISMPQTQVVVILYECQREDHVDTCGIIYTTSRWNALSLARSFSPSGNPNLARITLPDQSLSTAERSIIEAIKQQIAQS